MCTDAEPDARAAQCRDIGTLEIALPEVHEVTAGRERELPVIVDDELRARASAAAVRRADLVPHPRCGLFLDPQLHQAHAQRSEASHPGSAVDDRIDPRQFHPGHTLVMPRRHLHDVRELDSTTGAALMSAVVRISRAVGVAFPNQGLSLWHSIGEAAYQEVLGR